MDLPLSKINTQYDPQTLPLCGLGDVQMAKNRFLTVSKVIAWLGMESHSFQSQLRVEDQEFEASLV